MGHEQPSDGETLIGLLASSGPSSIDLWASGNRSSSRRGRGSGDTRRRTGPRSEHRPGIKATKRTGARSG